MMFVGQQFLQNVLGYSTFEAGLAILPAAILMVLVAPRSAKLVEAKGARVALLVGYLFCLLGFVILLSLWKEGVTYWKVGLGYALIGTGVGFAGTPASHSLTGSVPVKRAGMAPGRRICNATWAAPSCNRSSGRCSRPGTPPPSPRPSPRHRTGRASGAKQAFLNGDQWGVYGRHRRDPARRNTGLHRLPTQASGATVARQLPESRHVRRRREAELIVGSVSEAAARLAYSVHFGWFNCTGPSPPLTLIAAATNALPGALRCVHARSG